MWPYSTYLVGALSVPVYKFLPVLESDVSLSNEQRIIYVGGNENHILDNLAILVGERIDEFDHEFVVRDSAVDTAWPWFLVF